MSLIHPACCSGVLALALAGGAAAQDAGDAYSGSVSLATEYVFRGVSQTEEKPQLRAQVTWTHDSGLYAGVWSANTHFGGPGNSIEIDPFIGFAGSVGESPWSYDVGYWHYHYPGSDSDLDYGEIYAIVSLDASPWTLQGSVWHAPNYFGPDFFDDEPATALQATATYAFAGDLSLGFMYGVQTFDEPGDLTSQDYSYWTVTLAKSWEPFTFELVGWSTAGVEDDLASDDVSEERLVARIMIEF